LLLMMMMVMLLLLLPAKSIVANTLAYNILAVVALTITVTFAIQNVYITINSTNGKHTSLFVNNTLKEKRFFNIGIPMLCVFITSNAAIGLKYCNKHTSLFGNNKCKEKVLFNIGTRLHLLLQ
jgi:hypothetical protein